MQLQTRSLVLMITSFDLIRTDIEGFQATTLAGMPESNASSRTNLKTESFHQRQSIKPKQSWSNICRRILTRSERLGPTIGNVEVTAPYMPAGPDPLAF
ncbi:hypothetical protein [Bradyrhizobium sp. CCGE-LA001]|uniref:hypothetical protein n=1 Tax=Bradyrhizobium sp. CCGE-LA001 TaxID=1223566 RepID=UPI0011981E02|nr:hypothetical protein [Bradyrhizobium sp. CCGE-LA001]